MEDIMAGSISVRIEWKSIAKATGQTRHDLRLKVPNYVDKSKSGENSVLIKPASGDELFDLCKKLREQRQSKRALKKNINVAVAGILTFSADALKTIDTLDKSKQDELIMSAVKKISDTYDVDVVGLVVHRDEASIHAHFQLAGYNRQGYPLSNTIQFGDFSKLQDIAAEAFKPFGIERGKHKQKRIENGEDYSKYIHRTVKELHDDLPKEIERKREQIAELEKQIAEQQAKIEKNQRLILQNEQKLAQGKGDIEKIEKNIKIYQKREADAAAEINKLNAEKARIIAEIENSKQTLDKYKEILNNENPPKPPQTKIIKTGILKTEEKEVIEIQDFKKYDNQMKIWAAQTFDKENKKKKNELDNEKENIIKKEEEINDKINTVVTGYRELEKKIKEKDEIIKEKDNLINDTAKAVIGMAMIRTRSGVLRQDRAIDILKNFIAGGLSAVKDFLLNLSKKNTLSR